MHTTASKKSNRANPTITFQPTDDVAKILQAAEKAARDADLLEPDQSTGAVLARKRLRRGKQTRLINDSILMRAQLAAAPATVIA